MTWVTTLTRNLLVDHFRRTKQDRMTDSLDAAPSEHEDAMPFSEQLADTGAGPDAQAQTEQVGEDGAHGAAASCRQIFVKQ